MALMQQCVYLVVASNCMIRIAMLAYLFKTFKKCLVLYCKILTNKVSQLVVAA